MRRDAMEVEAPDPSAARAKSDELLARGRDAVRDRWLEVYLRESVRSRVARDKVRGALRFLVGHDRGVAVRVADERGARAGFAAASTWNDEALSWAIRRASSATTEELETPARPDGSLSAAFDHDPDLALPPASALEDRLASCLGVDAAGWIEAGSITEVVASSTGILLSRARRRLWVGRTEEGSWIPDASARTAISVGRGLDDLESPGSSWPETIERGHTRLGSRPAPLEIVLEPPAAASLVAALAGRLFGPESEPGLPVGVGLRLCDDPRHALSVVGGLFDDTGRVTSRTVLADGAASVGRLGGPGNRWRPSYRDYPEVRPSNLVVAHDPQGRLPLDAYRVVRLRVVPLGTGVWSLEVDGYRTSQGSPAEIFVGASVRGRPEALAASIAATAGTPTRLMDGVITPYLILRGPTLDV